jgi:hypothetical protein
MKHFNICSNIDNGVGLEADSKLLRDLLTSWGHQVTLIHYRKQNQIEEAPSAFANIYLEVINYNLIARRNSVENWFIPNPEWFAPWDHEAGLPAITKVLCKTQDAMSVMARHTDPAKLRHIGFESRDLYDPEIPRERKFLHVAGQSRYKNTMSTVYAFAKMLDEDAGKPLLTVVGAYPEEYAFGIGSKNITTLQRVTDESMRHLMNSHLFHLMPAGYEGWGHALNEGLGVGGVVITTNHPPMNEFRGICEPLLVSYQDIVPELAAMRARVVAPQVRDAVQKALKMSPEAISVHRLRARAEFLTQRDRFRETFKQIVEEA